MTKQRDLYGVDAKEWLRRWDEDGHVWSIEMGGLGPGYEQAIQVTAVEIVRDMLASDPKVDEWDDADKWRATVDGISDRVMPKLSDLGLSGAQWGAAVSLAAHIYRRGPATAFADEDVADRRIQVRRDFPNIATA